MVRNFDDDAPYGNQFWQFILGHIPLMQLIAKTQFCGTTVMCLCTFVIMLVPSKCPAIDSFSYILTLFVAIWRLLYRYHDYYIK